MTNMARKRCLRNGLSRERIKFLLDYNQKTGVFTWKRNPQSRFNGKRAGSLNPGGYVVIGIDGEGYLAHRLAWLLTTGFAPDGEIDHINRVRDDNRIENLRDVEHGLNTANASIRRDNKTGFKCVKADGERWVAIFRHRGRTMTIGPFDTLEEASSAYVMTSLKIPGRLVGEVQRSEDADHG